ncbi:amino acid ABC transporter permease [Gulosibacter chungangensis]|uniref:Amino acid ABC transporter permease n=1 Tax=Gulosibacter chungangensis TaxID=979746 RepID=A0A7J5BF32_9MICO|nr:amino acid ABC transporter permease [Gulosibacter chungangensis]KAB1644835.1 amino acid ABC transporter permease [Gulosibacter chungangensis]
MFLQQWIEWLPQMLVGLGTSLIVTIIAIAIGFPIGALLGIGTEAKAKWLRIVCIAIVEFGRGVPALVFLYLVYYGLANFGLTLTSFLGAVVGIALTSAAYSSELFRAGFEAVPRGEREASKALGMNYFYTMWDVVIPQGMRIALPSLIGLSIMMFQATALAYQIALPEVLSQAYSIGTRTFQYFSALSLAGVLYLVITIPLSYLSQHLSGGKKVGGGRTRRKSKRKSSVVPTTTAVPVSQIPH